MGMLRAGVVLFVVHATTEARADQRCGGRPLTDVAITCAGDACVLEGAPSVGAPVRLEALDGPDGATLEVIGSYGWFIAWVELDPGEHVCYWPGPDRARVVVPSRAKAAAEQDLFIDVYEGTPAPTEGDLLDVQFVDVVRVGDDCSGVVVGDHHVLTAAHCTGATTVEDASGQVHRVAEVRRAPDPVDAAILVTDRAVAIASPVRPRSRDPEEEPATGVVRVVGFGATDSSGTQGAGVRNYNDIAVSYWRCDADRSRLLGCLEGHEVVISGGGADACNGDSGGGVLDWYGDRWRLIAITSGRLPGTQTRCGSGGVYTHVGALAAWIDGEVER